MAKNISSFTKPHENIDMEKPNKADVHNQLDQTHKDLRQAIKNQDSDAIHFHTLKAKTLKELLKDHN